MIVDDSTRLHTKAVKIFAGAPVYGPGRSVDRIFVLSVGHISLK